MLLSLCFDSQAQWLTQTNVLKPGWSAVYLNVDASSKSLDQLITYNAACPIDQVWLWKTPVSAAQYISSPDSPLSASGRWITWVKGATNTPNTLGALIPNAGYLIHSTSTTNYTWRVLGKAVPPSYVWDLTGLNFIGFCTPANNPPNFQNFLAQAPSIADKIQLWQYVGGPLSATNPQVVLAKYMTPVTRGQAFWMSAPNIKNTYVNNTYFGPFNVHLPNPSGLDYGVSGGQLTLHLVNMTPNTLTVSARLLPSENPPYGQTAIVGPPPLLVEGALNSSNLTYACSSLPDGGASWTLAPLGQSGSDVSIVLGVNRFAMTSSAGAFHAGILQFTDSLGFSEVNVPVSATEADTTGLWVGNANVTQVSYDLKSYATNADGSLVISAVTNYVLTTNFVALGQTTNLLIVNNITTNQIVTCYQLTNQVVSTYTNEVNQWTTNGYVLTTNQVINDTAVSQVVIETDFTGYYYTNDNQLLVWETEDTTSGPTILSSTTTTNLLVITNSIAAVPTDGTPVTATNWVFYYSVTTNLTVTNGMFMDAVTNQTVSAYATTNPVVVTNAAYNVIGSNWVVTSIDTTTNWLVATNMDASGYATTNQPVAISYVVTNDPVAVTSAVTNYYPVATPLKLITNGANLISINVVTNRYLVNNWLYNVFTTNSVVISNNYTVNSGATNLVSSSTNVLAAWNNQTVSLATNSRTILTLSFATNAAYVITNNAMIRAVSNYVVTAYNTNLDAVAASYPLRLIVFNGRATGSSVTNCSLLQRVYYGLRQDTNVVVATTESVLDVSHLNTSRRITATHLPWTANNTHWTLDGGPLAQGSTLSATVTEAYDDHAANPFLHTYHPDHNNLNMNNSPPTEQPVGSESYTIKRQITLDVGANASSDFISLTTANSSLSGNYNETITLTGLGGAAKSYQTFGSFSLKRISPIGTLTTQ